MFDKTRYNSPWLHLLRLQVRRLTMQDYRDMDALSRNSNGLLAPPNGSIIRLVRNIVARFLTGGLDMLKVALPMSIFFYKFLEWWYRSDFHKSSQKQPIPPPPNPIKPHPDGVGLPDSPSICPLCKKERTNPAMASTGYVFCYPCIHRWVEEEGCCPVTRVKIVTDDIRKLYTMNA
ncbi:ubiquitin-protein ligase peroxin 12 [Spiromyces aspiralis]|uniref:Ubiquitin-protein ligase peroxin 12 n=1 Tax=Spiromyces aspiralis TaxID=68401 RepID=A0ACC1HDB9_9FUNG|nr:ubiquitin-protein ligase peroxin 12 [Spiromyces aspiralis]